jgi:hypothetical protein
MSRSFVLGLSLAALLGLAAPSLAATPKQPAAASVGLVKAAGAGTGAAATESSKAADSATAGDEDQPPRPPTLLEREVIGARETADELRFRSDHVQQLLRSARRARYHERVACLDDMLSQAHAVERDAEQSIHTASKAAERDDSYGVERELVHLWIYDLRSRGLLLNAEQCGSEQARFAVQ